jgi:hypothetical protein
VKRTTILADDELLLEVKHLARQQGRTVTSLIQEALREYLSAHRPPRRLSFAGVGSSGDGQTIEELDRLLVEGLDPIEGWSPSRRSELMPDSERDRKAI